MNIETEDYTFKPVITHCAVDLPAKSGVQEIKQHGGYSSCTFCKIPGEIVLIAKKPKKKSKQSLAINNEEIQANKFVRYVEGNEKHELRDEAETLKQMLAASKSNGGSDGIKGNVGPIPLKIKYKCTLRSISIVKYLVRSKEN